MLAALMVFKSLDVERARLTYNLCYSKRKMVCRKHYREAVSGYLKRSDVLGIESGANIRKNYSKSHSPQRHNDRS